MKIESKVKNYLVEMSDHVLEHRDLFWKGHPGRLFYFIDQKFYKFYEPSLKAFIRDDFHFLIEATEENKSYLKLADYYRVLIENRFTRKDILVTFGGGILQDISGFIASTLYRGIPWVFFPTTLLAQADSCIGSKTSINFDDSKNLIGTFYPPDSIYIDVGFTETLTPSAFNSGLGEIIKFHLLSDARRYEVLRKYLSSAKLRDFKNLKQIILSTLEIKKSYFDQDEFDTGRRNLLNYGHCFGHALESVSDFVVSHGEAVIVGMGFANLLSLKRGMIQQKEYTEFEDILQKYYPRFDVSRITADSIIYYLKRDKKRVGNQLTMILARGLGDHVKIDDIREEEVISVYQEFFKNYPRN